MEKEPIFIGRKYDEEEKTSAQEGIKRWSEEDSKPLEGEGEKTASELAMIEVINDLLEKECKSLGIEDIPRIDPKHIHILSDEIFNKHFPNSPSSQRAFARGLPGTEIYVNRERMGINAKGLHTLLHEAIHRVSTHKFYMDKEKIAHNSRVGYNLNTQWKDDESNKLRGFNELMVDLTARKILITNTEILKERLDIAEEDAQDVEIYSYLHYNKILWPILEKIAEYKKISVGEVLNSFEKGQFSNTILSLKEVDKVFGKGSMRILALLESLDDEDKNNELERMIQEYFEAEDAGKRKNIKEKIDNFMQNDHTT